MFSAGTWPAGVSLPCSAAILFTSANVLGLKGLERGEPLGAHSDLVDQGEEPRRWVAVERHLVVVGEVGEHDRASVADIQCVLDQSVGIHIGLVDLALGPVLAEK